MARKSKAAASELLERPLTARSVIASLLLGRHPPSAPASLLVRWCALFGISETSTRVALSRMVQRGELDASDGTYTLVGRIRERQTEQELALDPVLPSWDGRWLLAIVQRGTRAADERVALRREMERQRMVVLRDGTWIRPANLPPGFHRGVPGCGWWTATAGEGVDVAAVLGTYALAPREVRTVELLRRLTAATARLPDPGGLAGAFVVGAAVAQHLRRDPLLPAELLPDAWHADDLRAAYRSYLPPFGAAVAAWADSA